MPTHSKKPTAAVLKRINLLKQQKRKANRRKKLALATIIGIASGAAYAKSRPRVRGIPKMQLESDPLDTIVAWAKQFPQTEYCYGPQGNLTRWFEYLFKAKYVNANICHGNYLEIEMRDGKKVYNLFSGNKRVEKKLFFDKCNERFVFMLIILLYDKKTTHSNVVMIDLELKKAERFDADGPNHTNAILIEKYVKVGTYTNKETAVKELLVTDIEIDNIFRTYFENMQFDYEGPLQYCPLVAPQNLLHNVDRCKNRNRTSGFCNTFGLIYGHLRLLAPESSVRQVIKALSDMKQADLRDLILRYTSAVTMTFPDMIVKGKGDDILRVQ